MHYTLFNRFTNTTNIPPSIYIALALIGGIWGQSLFQISLHTLYCLLIITTTTALIFGAYQNKQNWHAIILATTISFVFAFLGACRYQQFIQSYQLSLGSISGKTLSIHGIITDKEAVFVNRFTHRITLMTTKICDAQTNTIIDTNNYYIQIYTLQSDPFMVSDSIFIPSVTIKEPSKKTFIHYLMKNEITATLFLSHADWQLISRPNRCLYRFFYTLKHRLYAQAKECLSDQTFSLYSALFLGKKTETDNPKNIINEFRQWGISHLLARSGIHLSLIALLWIFLFRLIPLPFTLKQFLLISIALFYNCLSWSSVSFARALWSFLYCHIAFLCKQRNHLLHTVALVCIFFLLKNPIYLFFVDFQLSFLLTACLIWLNEITYKQSV